jgi:hypothetical protein
MKSSASLLVASLLAPSDVAARVAGESLEAMQAKARSMHASDTLIEVADWTVVHRDVGEGTTVSSYLSPALSLMTGAAVYTNNPMTEMPFPSGDYSISHVNFSIVDEAGESKTPLSEVYNHHWLIGTSTSYNVVASCEGDMFFGAGAEMRGMPKVFPAGYGLRRIGSSGVCGANLHFLRTVDLNSSWTGLNDPGGSVSAAVKTCIECGWAPARVDDLGELGQCPESADGAFACCLTGSRCPVNNPSDLSKKDYRLSYDVRWSRNLTAVASLQTGMLDVAGDFIEWDIDGKGKQFPAPVPGVPSTYSVNQTCTSGAGAVCTTSRDIAVGVQPTFAGLTDTICAGRLLSGYMHMHIGAINASLHHNGRPVCMSNPVYGDDPNNPPGNELGYVVDFSYCIDAQVPADAIRLEKGDSLTLTTNYDVDEESTRGYPFPGGKHGGVMGLFFYQIDCDDDAVAAGFACRQGDCISVPKGKNTSEFDTLGDCLSKCK